MKARWVLVVVSDMEAIDSYADMIDHDKKPIKKTSVGIYRFETRKAAKEAEAFIVACGNFLQTKIVDDDHTLISTERNEIFREGVEESMQRHLRMAKGGTA